MKRTIIILSALLIALGLTQCKKSEQPADNQGEGVTISLQVKRSNDAKILVNTETGSVDYEAGDQILVASAGKYVGTLTYNGTLNEGAMFSGTIANATEGQPLQFFSLGNLTPAETLTSGITESCSVVISDQTEHLPVISAAPSFENFAGNLTEYTAIMRNKCALVKFDVNTASTAATCITGFNNKVTVNFMENSLAYSQEGEGVITLPAGSGERWAILLPQEAMEAGDEGSATSVDGYYSGTVGAVPTIDNNAYLTFGIPVTVNTYVVPVGALGGLFSVSDTTQVHFSQGNLQYIGSAATPYWQFAENQWDYLGDNGQGSTSQTVDRDLFCWATSGYNHGAVGYQPWATRTYSSDYRAYGSATKNLYDAKNDGSMQGQADWGYNAIANGGNMENSGWRTLTNDEWGYVFNSRTDADSKWGQGKVNGVNGMILLPDNWTLPEGLTFIPGQRESEEWSYDSLVYNAEQWAQMEFNGAVFLPAAGHRLNRTLDISGEEGGYWSSSYFDSDFAYQVQFFGDFLLPQRGWHRTYGWAVRLVRRAE